MWLGSVAGTREGDRSLWEGSEKGEAFVGFAWLSHHTALLCQPEGAASAFGVVQALCASSQKQDPGDKLCLRTSQASPLCP